VPSELGGCFSPEKQTPKKTIKNQKPQASKEAAFHQKSNAPTKETPKNQKPLPFLVEAFDWDGMGGNIGGLSVYVLALDIMYSALVE
jgi:hypothetical protein